MIKRRLLGGTGAAFAVALLLALPAVGATPKEIYKDYADNGTLDKQYSQSDLQRVLHDASVQGYGSPVIIIKVKQPKKGITGDKTPAKQPRRPGIVVVPPKKGLPFTGAELGLFTVVGLGLIGSGILLRLSGRKRSSN